MGLFARCSRSHDRLFIRFLTKFRWKWDVKSFRIRCCFRKILRFLWKCIICRLQLILIGGLEVLINIVKCDCELTIETVASIFSNLIRSYNKKIQLLRFDTQIQNWRILWYANMPYHRIQFPNLSKHYPSTIIIRTGRYRLL